MSEELTSLEKKLVGTNIIIKTSSYDDKNSYFSYQLKIEEEMVLTFGMLESIVKNRKDSGFVQQTYNKDQIWQFIKEENEFLDDLVEEGQLDSTLLSNIKEYAKLYTK